MNGEYITACPHDDAVTILRNAGELVVLTVKHYRAATPFLQKQRTSGTHLLCMVARASKWLGLFCAAVGGGGIRRIRAGGGGGKHIRVALLPPDVCPSSPVHIVLLPVFVFTLLVSLCGDGNCERFVVHSELFRGLDGEGERNEKLLTLNRYLLTFFLLLLFQ